MLDLGETTIGCRTALRLGFCWPVKRLIGSEHGASFVLAPDFDLTRAEKPSFFVPIFCRAIYVFIHVLSIFLGFLCIFVLFVNLFAYLFTYVRGGSALVLCIYLYVCFLCALFLFRQVYCCCVFGVPSFLLGVLVAGPNWTRYASVFASLWRCGVFFWSSCHHGSVSEFLGALSTRTWRRVHDRLGAVPGVAFCTLCCVRGGIFSQVVSRMLRRSGRVLCVVSGGDCKRQIVYAVRWGTLRKVVSIFSVSWRQGPVVRSPFFLCMISHYDNDQL